jgi:hypothetical protein
MKTNILRSAIIAPSIAAAFLLAGTHTSSALPNIGLFSTGVDNSGNALPLHATELHYAVSGVVSAAYIVPKEVGQVPPSWIVAPSGSAWIGPNQTDSTFNSDPVGIYHYKLSIDLTGFDPSSVRIGGTWATDDEAHLFLNGQNTGFSKGLYGFTQLDAFNLQSGFVAGINTIDFTVQNDAGPSGLLVTGWTMSVVPEPSTACFVGLISVMAAGARLLRSRKATRS